MHKTKAKLYMVFKQILSFDLTEKYHHLIYVNHAPCMRRNDNL